ncbi:hypothetical protein CRG98_000685 [Punica granatum]|uniref:Uncharacterized protein n=1 Tax=Punica granatum TaxID=22663 RepID=A0A2I0LE12_PUNGR|nr:hypothetical protein CRG98_000685 [Punica granatum]
MIGGGTAEVGAGTDAETGTGTDVEIGGGTSIGGSNIVAEGTRVTAGRLARCEKEGGAGRLLTGWAAGVSTIVGNMPGVGPKMQVAKDESGKLPDVLVARLHGTRVVVAHA